MRAAMAMEALDLRVLLSGNLDTTFNGSGAITAGTNVNPGGAVAAVERTDQSRYVLTNLAIDNPASAIYGSANGFTLTSLDPASLTPTRQPFVFNVLGGVHAEALIDAAAATGGSVSGFYVVGTVYRPVLVSGAFQQAGDVIIVHVGEDGQLDTSFGGGKGYRTYDLSGSGSFDTTYGAGMDAAGQIIVAARTAGTSSASFLKVESDGTPTSGFGTAGVATDSGFGSILNLQHGKVLAVETDGSFFLAASAQAGTLGVVKYLPSGARDTSFGTGGQYVISSGAIAREYSIDLQGGNVYAGGVEDGNLLVAEFTEVGGTPTFYGPSGAYVGVSLDAGPSGVIVAGLRNASGTLVVDLTELGLSGVANTGYMNQGGSIGATAFLGAPVVAVGPGGRAFLASALDPGSTGQATDTRLSEFAPDGTLLDDAPLPTVVSAAPGQVAATVANADGSSFVVTSSVNLGAGESLGFGLVNRDGSVATFSSIDDRFRAISVVGAFALPGGTGYAVVMSAIDSLATPSNPEIVIGYFNSDGTLNSSMFSGGFIDDLPQGNDIGWFAKGAALDETGTKVIVAGVAGTNRFLLLYDLGPGTPDGSLGSGGVVLTGGGGAAYLGVTVDPVHHRIFAIGNNEVDAFTLSGAPDTTWGSGGVVGVGGADSIGQSLAVDQVTGRLYAGGASKPGDGSQKYFLTALALTTGAVDTTFNGGSTVVSATSGSVLSTIRGIAVDTSSNNGAVVVAGSDGNAPLVARFNANGTRDASYAPTFSPGADHYGEFVGITMDPAGRALPFGQQETTAGSSRTGIVYRFQPAVLAAPTVSRFTPLTAPTPGDTLGYFTVVVTARPSTSVSVSSLPGSIDVRRLNDNTSVAATFVGYRILDPQGYGNIIEAKFSYAPAGGVFPNTQETYIFDLNPGVVKDDIGEAAPGGNLGSVDVQDPGGAQYNPSTGFGGTGTKVLPSAAVSAGQLVQTLQGADGFTYLLTNLSPADFGRPFDSNLTVDGGAMITRFTAAGALDTSYGIGGHYVFSEGVGFTATALLDLGAGNGMAIVGTSFTLLPDTMDGRPNVQADVAVAKVTSAGTLDLSFGGGAGYRNYDLAGSLQDEIAEAAAVDPSGRIVVGAYADDDIALLRVMPDGSPDATFSNGTTNYFAGAISLPFSSFGAEGPLAVDATGIYLAGRSSSRPAVAKLTNSGAADASFDSDGIVQAPGGSDFISGIVVSAGKLYTLTSTSGGSDIFLAKLDASTGAVDPGFNSGSALALSAPAGHFLFGYGVFDVTSSGDVIVAAASSDGMSNETTLFDVTPAGVLSPTFNGGNPLLLPYEVGQVSSAGGVTRLAATSDPSGTGVEPPIQILAIGAGGLDATFNPAGATPGVLQAPAAIGALPAQVVASTILSDGSVFTLSELVNTFADGHTYLQSQLVDRYGNALGGSVVDLGANGSWTFAGAIQVGGKFVTMAAVTTGVNASLSAITFNADGTLDTTSGTAGITLLQSYASDATVTGAAIDQATNSTIFVIGRADGIALFGRYDIVGSGTFAAYSLANASATPTAIATGGSTVYVGFSGPSDSTYPTTYVERFNSGVLDTGWGANGIVDATVAGPGTSIVTSIFDASAFTNGPIYIAGSVDYHDGTYGRFVQASAPGNGALYTNFGGTGQVVEDTGGLLDGVGGIDADNDGVFVAGAAFNHPSYELLRPDGSLAPAIAIAYDPRGFGTLAGISHMQANPQWRIVYGAGVPDGTAGGASSATVTRLRSFAEGYAPNSSPTVTSLTPSAPRYGDTSATVTLVISTQVGLTFNSVSFSGMLLVSLPGNATPVSASLVSSMLSADRTTLTVIYSYSPANGTFGASQGTYGFSLAAGAFPDEDGNVALQAGSQIGATSVTFTPPTASLGIIGDPLLGASSFSFSVTYSTSRSIDLTTLGAGNLLVTLNGQPFGTVTYVGSTTFGTDTIANYTLVPDGGTFGPSTAGLLVIAIPTTGAVTDDLGTPVSVQTLYGRSLTYAPVTASFGNANGSPRFGTGSYVFTVTFVPATGNAIDPNSLAGANVVAELNGAGYGTVSLASFLTNQDGSVTVTYVLSPRNAAFSAGDNGTLTLLLASGRPVFDNEGNTVNPGLLQTLTLAYAPVTATVTAPPVPPVGSTSLTFTVTFTPAPGHTIDPNTASGALLTVTTPGGQTFQLSPTLSDGPRSPLAVGQSLTLTYVLNAPNGTFTTADVGTYVVAVPAVNQLADTVGDRVTVGTAGQFAVQYGRPSAAIVGTPAQPALGQPGQVTVRFTPAQGQSFAASNFTANSSALLGVLDVNIGAGGSQANISISSIVDNGDGTFDVTYLYSATSTPNSTFTTAQGGTTYSFVTVPGALADSGGQTVDAAPLGVLTVAFAAPTATATFAQPALGATSATFTVTYVPLNGAAIDAGSLGDDDVTVTVTLASGTQVLQARFVSFDPATSTATYSFSAPSGTFDNSTSSTGLYSFNLIAGSVLDTRNIPVGGTQLGKVSVGGAPATITGVSAPSGSFLPGQNISPTVTLTNSATDFPTRSFYVNFYAIVGGTPVFLGNFTVASVAAGATVTLSPPAGVPLPPSVSLPAGAYTITAQVSEIGGGTVGNVVAATGQVAVVAPPLPKPGTLDPNFGGGDGVVQTFVPTVKLTLVGSVSQDNVLIPGETTPENQVVYSAGYDALTGKLVILRFKGDGSLDTGFGTEGIMSLTSVGGTSVAAQFVADPTSSHRMVLAATTVVDGVTYFTVVRFNADGQPDVKFANAGVLQYVPTGATATQLRGIQADKFGRLYLLGSITALGGTAKQGVVVRLASSGLVDSSFGSGGVISAAPNGAKPGVLPLADGFSELTSLLLLDDRILVGGNSGTADGASSRYVVAALQYTGQLDTTFGAKGLYLGALGSSIDRVTTLSLAPIGTSIYVGGSHADTSANGATAVVFRLTSAGKLDRGFNRGAPLLLQTNTALSTVSSLLPSINNTMLVTVATANDIAGAVAGQIGTVVFRLTTSGANDPLFNGGAALVLVAIPGTTGTLALLATDSAATDFDSFVQSKQGSATIVTGGNIRAIAATPLSEGTSLTIAQLSADGFDLSPVLVVAIPATLAKLPYKGTAKVVVSNTGSLASNGKFSVKLVGDTSVGTPLDLVDTSFSGKIAPGSSRTFSVKFVVAKGTAPGTYTLTVTLGTTIGKNNDANPGNNSTADDATFTVPGASAAAARTASPSIAFGAPVDSWASLPDLFQTKKLFSRNSILA